MEFSSLLENELKQYKDKIKYHQLNIDINKVRNDEGWIFENVKGGLMEN